MLYRLQEYGICHKAKTTGDGDGSRLNDNIYPRQDADAEGVYTYVVTNGIGQAQAASELVCRALASKLNALESIDAASISSVFDSAYYAISHIRATSQVAVTTAALRFTPQGVVAAHLGNCAILHIRPGRTPESTKILYQSRPHTYANYLADRGQMTAAEARVSEKRNMLTRAIIPGATRRCKPEARLLTDITADDYFLLCTDTALQRLSADGIRAIFSHDGGTLFNKRGLIAKLIAEDDAECAAIIINVSEVVVDTPSETPRPKTEHETKIPNKISSLSMNIRNNTSWTSSLTVKLIIAFFVVLSALMVFYSLFIRKDEVLQQAGTAIDAPANTDAQETYGYEITARDISNAESSAPIDASATEEDIDDVLSEDSEEAILNEITGGNTPAEAPASTPEGTSEPILQE